MNSKPASKRFLPVLMLFFVSLACALPGGILGKPAVTPTVTVTVSVAEHAAEITVTPDPAVEAPACHQASEGTLLYTSLENGFCLLYPHYFEISQDWERPEEIFLLLGPSLDSNAMETIRVYLRVEYNGPAGDLDAAGYASKWKELFTYGEETSDETATIAGFPAVIMHNLPAFSPEQSAFLVANGARYRITMSPERDTIDSLNMHTSLLWDTVMNSIVFFPPQTDRVYLDAQAACAQESADASLYVNQRDGYCFLYPKDFELNPDFQGQVLGGPVLEYGTDWGDLRTSITVGTYGPAGDQTVRQVVEPWMPYIDPGSLQDTTIGGFPALTMRDSRGQWASRLGMVISEDYVYTILGQPWEPERYPEGISYLEELWSSVLGSIKFFQPWR